MVPKTRQILPLERFSPFNAREDAKVDLYRMSTLLLNSLSQIGLHMFRNQNSRNRLLE